MLSRLKSVFRHTLLKVIPGVYQLVVLRANIHLIIEDGVTLIDTGFRGSSLHIISALQKLGHSIDEVKLIILTHNHCDHAGGLAELLRLCPAAVAIHREDYEEAGDYQCSIPRAMFLNAVTTKLNNCEVLLSGGEVLPPLGGLEVIHTPGHTPGSISLYSPREKLLFAGDALNKRIALPPRLPTAHFRQAASSAALLADLDTEAICFGHGLPLRGEEQARLRALIHEKAGVDNAR